MTNKLCIDCGQPFPVFAVTVDKTRCVLCHRRHHERQMEEEEDSRTPMDSSTFSIFDTSSDLSPSYDPPSMPDSSPDTSSGFDGFGGGGGFDGGGSSGDF